MQIHPKKKGMLLVSDQPLYCARDHFSVVTLNRLVSALPALRLMELGIVNIEAAIIALKRTVLRVELNRSHERGGAISSRVKQIRQIR